MPPPSQKGMLANTQVQHVCPGEADTHPNTHLPHLPTTDKQRPPATAAGGRRPTPTTHILQQPTVAAQLLPSRKPLSSNDSWGLQPQASTDTTHTQDSATPHDSLGSCAHHHTCRRTVAGSRPGVAGRIHPSSCSTATRQTTQGMWLQPLLAVRLQ